MTIYDVVLSDSIIGLVGAYLLGMFFGFLMIFTRLAIFTWFERKERD
jgi:hypothetical protein